MTNRDTTSRDNAQPHGGNDAARAEGAKLAAAAFGELVSLYVRSPAHNTLAIKDLEWALLPALMNRSFAIAHTKMPGSEALAPVGAVLWASVSAEVDGRLADTSKPNVRLQPDEWRSGDILWLMDVLGDRRAVNGVLDKLMDSVFRDKTVKMRSATKEGTIVIGSLKRPEPAARGGGAPQG